jgi:hemoglobin
MDSSIVNETSASLPKADLQAFEVYGTLGGNDGGAPEAFAALVDAFYEGVEHDPILRPMYPTDAEGMTESRENLALFLIQYFGGPALYAEKRGHPRLRMRHFPFAIGPEARDAWIKHMDAAIDAVPALAPVAPLLREYFLRAAHFLQNRE